MYTTRQITPAQMAAMMQSVPERIARIVLNGAAFVRDGVRYELAKSGPPTTRTATPPPPPGSAIDELASHLSTLDGEGGAQ